MRCYDAKCAPPGRQSPDMLDRKQEGTLRVKASETRSGAFDVAFTLAGREALEKFLSDLGVPEETRKRALGAADSRGSGSILGVLVSQAEIEGNWPQLRS